MAVPIIPAEIRHLFSQLKEKTGVDLDILYRFMAQDLFQYLNVRLNTQGDVTVITAGKGTVVTNSAGTITKRIKLNDAGTDITIESV